MTKYFLLMSCFLMATASALAQQFPMDQFIGVNLRREDPIERLKCVGFVREYHDWAVDELNAYNFHDTLRTLRDSFGYPRNRYSWNLQQSTATKFDTFYPSMRTHLGSSNATRPPICVTMKQALPFLVGGDLYGSYSELKPVAYTHLTGRLRGTGFRDNKDTLAYLPHHAWDSVNSYQWIADWLYQFTRRYGANSNAPYPKLHVGESNRAGLNRVGYIELWNEPNKYWIRNPQDSSWLKSTQFTGAEYAAMASTCYDGHGDSLFNHTIGGNSYAPGVKNADPSMKYVMGGSAGIREYDWKFLKDMTDWFAQNRNKTRFSRKYPFDVIHFHHYNSGQWFGVNFKASSEATSPEADRWNIGTLGRLVYPNARSSDEDSIPSSLMNTDLDPTTTTYRTFKQRLVELRYRVDSLLGNPNPPVELWMSEFGFDTNEKSPYKVASINQNGTFADQQEVQARFIVRGYLEIAAAKWDRAMQFDFRDEKSYDGFLFQASGLLKDKENNHAPKKSYYYVHTMKEALKGKKFTEEIQIAGDPTFTTIGRFQGHSYWYKDETYHRILRFADPIGNAAQPGQVVYVTWLPTKTNARKSNVKIYLSPTDVAATQATVVRMSIGDINGIREKIVATNIGLEGNRRYIIVPEITETPIFIRLGESITDNGVAMPTIDSARGISCDAIRVNLSATAVPANGFLRAYYYEQPKSEWVNVPANIDIANRFIKLYADNIKCNEFVITGLQLPHNEYKLYIEAVDSNNNISPTASINAFTTSCFNNYVPIQEMSAHTAAGEYLQNFLFNYDTIDFCYPLRKKQGNYNHLEEWATLNADQFDITLKKDYQLDAISLLEGTGVGVFEIQVLDTATNAVLKSITHAKTSYDEWKTLPLCNVIARKLRFLKSPNARIRKIILKGKPAAAANYVVACCGDNDSLIHRTPLVRVTNSNALISTLFPRTTFYGYYTDFGIDDGKFTIEGDYFLQTHYGYGNGSLISGCNINTLNGAGLVMWKGGQPITLLNNYIDCGLATRSVDAVGIGSYFHSNATVEVEIHTNTIRGASAPRSAIISLGTLNNVMLRRNILKFNSYESRDTNPAWGIKMNLLENSTIVRNEIFGNPSFSGNYAWSPGQVGMLSSNSRNNFIYCDSIKNAKIGIQFQYNNLSVTNDAFGMIAGNRFSGYNIGLKVDSFALIGSQTHRSNIWTSPAAGNYQLDAVLEDTTPARKANNRFVVKSDFRPSRLSPVTEWFQDVNNPPSASIFDCSQVPGIRSGTGSAGVYETVISDDQAPEGYLWMLEKQAFEVFSELPANLQTATMQTFLNDKRGTEIETFYQLKKGFETLFQQDDQRAARLKVLVQFMNDWTKKKQLTDNQPIAEDTFINEWSKEYMDLAETEKQSAIAKAVTLRQLNSTIIDDIPDFLSKNVGTNKQRPYVFYEKVVNDLYLSKIIEGTTVYTVKEAIALKKIAMMCPLVAGEAPMKARIIYQHFIDKNALPEPDCKNVPKITSKMITKPHFNVYPNPATNQFILVSEDHMKNFDWVLFTSTGIMVKAGNCKSFRETIDTQDLVNGVYFICIKEKGIVTTTLKVVVMK